MNRSVRKSHTLTPHEVAPANPVVPPEEDDYLLENVQRLAGLGTITKGIAQELASMLSVIMAASDGLRNELQQSATEDVATLRYYINLIERNAFRGAQIVTLLQAYTSLQAPQMAVTDIEAIVHDALALVDGQFRQHNDIGIKVTMPDEPRSIVCDHNRIVQLVVNLLTDARNSLPADGGHIELVIREVLTGERVAGHREHIAIVVTDNEAGVADDEQNQIFAPLITPRANGDGVSFGMSIAQDIVRQHNGAMWVTNENGGPGLGTAVTVILPVRPSA